MLSFLKGFHRYLQVARLMIENSVSCRTPSLDINTFTALVLEIGQGDLNFGCDDSVNSSWKGSQGRAASVSVLTNVVNANRIDVNRLMIISLPYKSDVLTFCRLFWYQIVFLWRNQTVGYSHVSKLGCSIRWAIAYDNCIGLKSSSLWSLYNSLGFLIVTWSRISFKSSGLPARSKGVDVLLPLLGTSFPLTDSITTAVSG